LRPKRFTYHSVSSISEATALLKELGPNAKILAGGQSLVPLMKLRLVEFEHLVDITALKELRYIRDDGASLQVGALTTHHDLETSLLLRNNSPSLSDAAYVVGDPLIRNRGTIGGVLSHYDPSADYPAVLVSLDATITIASQEDERDLGADGFFEDFFTTQMRPDELLLRVRVPSLQKGEGSAYLKLEKAVGDFAIVGAAAFVQLGPQGRIARMKVALSAVGGRPVVAEEMANSLVGEVPTQKMVEDAAQTILSILTPPSDIRASSAYRREMAVVFARRAVLDAISRAEGKNPVFVAQNQPLRAN
jgi:aerobic carbon-monoxide dehydrogenase medium subunit